VTLALLPSSSRWALCVFVIAIAAVAAACGGGEERATVESVSVAPTDQPKERVSSEQLRSALILLEDLPAGWTVIPPEPQKKDEDFCGFEKQKVHQPVAEANASFQQSESDSFLGHILESYDGNEAEDVADQFLAVSRSCSGWTATDDQDGHQTKWQLTKLSFPNVGDQTVAVRLTSATRIGAVELDFALVRRGQTISTISYATTGLQGIDSARTEEFVRLADQKLQSLDELR